MRDQMISRYCVHFCNQWLKVHKYFQMVRVTFGSTYQDLSLSMNPLYPKYIMTFYIQHLVYR